MDALHGHCTTCIHSCITLLVHSGCSACSQGCLHSFMHSFACSFLVCLLLEGICCLGALHVGALHAHCTACMCSTMRCELRQCMFCNPELLLEGRCCLAAFFVTLCMLTTLPPFFHACIHLLVCSSFVCSFTHCIMQGTPKAQRHSSSCLWVYVAKAVQIWDEFIMFEVCV